MKTEVGRHEPVLDNAGLLFDVILPPGLTHGVRIRRRHVTPVIDGTKRLVCAGIEHKRDKVLTLPDVGQFMNEEKLSFVVGSQTVIIAANVNHIHWGSVGGPRSSTGSQRIGDFHQIVINGVLEH